MFYLSGRLAMDWVFVLTYFFWFLEGYTNMEANWRMSFYLITNTNLTIQSSIPGRLLWRL